jgi:hypothetical protein
MEPTPDREENMLAEMLDEIKAPAAYSIENMDDEIVIRIPRGVASEQQIRRYLALLMLDAVRQKSQLTEEDAYELAEEVTRAVWERNRHRVKEAG